MKQCLKKIKYFCLLWLFCPLLVQAADGYPRLANYYLSFFRQNDYASLARWDLLVIQPDMAFLQAGFFPYYRAQHPQGKVLAYLYPSSFFEPTLFYDTWGWRRELKNKIQQEDWWLKDEQGQKVKPWAGLYAVNLTDEDWQKFNWRFIDKYYNLDKWDGAFFDLVDAEAAYYSDNLMDIDNDGQGDNAAKVNSRWQKATSAWLELSRQRLVDKLIIINGNSWPAYQSNINRRMFETFPTPWEGSGRWWDSMEQYLQKLPALNYQPQIYIINGVYDAKLKESPDEQMRFALASTLLGDGYFSFDAGESSHSQQWWFDEYEVNLGEPEGQAQNLGNGLWRRDFTNGAVVVNSGAVKRQLTLPAGRFKRLAGLTEPQVNNGQAVVELTLCPRRGLLLLKQATPQPDLTKVARSFDWQAANQPVDWWLTFRRQIEEWLSYFRR